MLAQDAPETPTATESASTEAAQASPETEAAPPAAEDAGQTTLPADEQPQPEGETEGDGGSEDGVLSNKTDNAELAQAIAGLSPTERKSALELVKALQPGEIPRIAKLVSQRHAAEQTIEAQQRQIEELQARVETGSAAATPEAAMPSTVAALKTVADVEARRQLAEANAEALQDFLDANPGDAGTSYTIDGREVTRQELIEKRKVWREELKALPRKAAQLQTHAQLNQARTAARAQLAADFPEFNDPENPDVKVAAQLVKGPKFADEVNADYLALAMARGHRELQAELAARKAGKNGSAFTKPAARQVAPGKVPPGKPHAPSGGAPAAVRGAGVKAALETHGKNGSRNSLAEVIRAGGL